MYPSFSPLYVDEVEQRRKRESALYRSLRECATDRLSHRNPFDLMQPSMKSSQSDTSHAQWKVRYRGDSFINEAPVSEDSPSTMYRDSRKTPEASEDGHSVRSCSVSSDSERRHPTFPGNRDIMDSRQPSFSPSPPSRHSAELQTPSPVSETIHEWNSPRVSLDLKLHTHESPNSSKAYETGCAESYNKGIHGSFHQISPPASVVSTPPTPQTPLPYTRYDATVASSSRNSGIWRHKDMSAIYYNQRYSPYPHEESEYDTQRGVSTILPPIRTLVNGPYLPYENPGQRSRLSTIPVISEIVTSSRDKNAWKEHARCITVDGEQVYRCMWRVGCDGNDKDYCGYTAKRHLVKRHIETRHLHFKDHKCTFCGKAFPQRVSLNIHLNRHTGEKPHPCKYTGCDKRFSDPARRHKHMVEVHSYSPQGPRKRHRTTEDYHKISSLGA